MNSLILAYPTSYFYPNKGLSNYKWTTGDYVFLAVGLALLAAVVIYFFILFFRKKPDKKGWGAGLIPNDFLPTHENIFELYVAAGAAMIVRDPSNYVGKIPLMAAYLRKQFPKQYYEFADSVTYSLKHVVKLDSLSTWVDKHFTQEQRVELADFMTYVAVCDGGLNASEKAYLFSLFKKIRVQLSEVSANYQQFFSTSDNEQAVSRSSSCKSDYDLLGIEPGASAEEIKQAYRTLVKMTHPDRFAHESEEVRKQMTKKFQEIQQAYENLTK